MIDLLIWSDEAVQRAHAFQRRRRAFLSVHDADTWHALQARMLAAGFHELRDEALLRLVKTAYLAVMDASPSR